MAVRGSEKTDLPAGLGGDVYFPMSPRAWSLALVLGVGTGCTGTVSGGNTPGVGSPTGNAGTAGTTPTGTATPGMAGATGAAGAGAAGTTPLPNSPAPTALRRLGKQELTNTLRDLFPDLPASFAAPKELPADNAVLLAFSVPGSVSDLEVKRFMDLAEATIAALGTKTPGAQVSCAGQDETACARAFV